MIPSEDAEQANLVQYCDIKGYPRFRVPNETYTKSWNQKRKNKMLGVSAGVPDLFVVAHGKLIAVEMKRTKGSTTSQAQKDWIETLNNAGIPAQVCKGAEAAIEFIESCGKTSMSEREVQLLPSRQGEKDEQESTF